MKILHVIDLISQTRAGGSAKVPYHLAKEQAKQGHKVTIYASDWDAKDQESPEGAELVKFKAAVNISGYRITPGLLMAKVNDYDIIHLHNYRTFLNVCVSWLARRAKVPYVLQAHGSMLIARHKKLLKQMDDIVWSKSIMHQADKLIAVSNIEVKQYEDMGNSRDRIVTVPNGIDVEEFRILPPRGEFRKQYNIKPDEKIVLYLGRIHEIKGLELLAKAFARLNRQDTTLVITGYDDGYKSKFTALTEELGIACRILYTGAAYGIDKLRIYTDADVYVLPSRYEIFGITVLEALACGTPVIVTDRCGLKDIVHDEYGMTVLYDKVKLADAMLKIIKDDTMELFRYKRKALAQQYGWAKIAKQMDEVYQSVLFQGDNYAGHSEKA
jgi:glycosyltransferase involved in cell wall biosynthesis